MLYFLKGLGSSDLNPHTELEKEKKTQKNSLHRNKCLGVPKVF